MEFEIVLAIQRVDGKAELAHELQKRQQKQISMEHTVQVFSATNPNKDFRG